MSLLSINEIMRRMKEDEEERRINLEEEDYSDELTPEDIEAILSDEKFDNKLFTLAIILLLIKKDNPKTYEEFVNQFLQ